MYYQRKNEAGVKCCQGQTTMADWRISTNLVEESNRRWLQNFRSLRNGGFRRVKQERERKSKGIDVKVKNTKEEGNKFCQKLQTAAKKDN